MLLTPVLLTLVLAVIQAALWWHAAHVADAAAGRGAVEAARLDATTGDGLAAAQGFAADAGAELASPPVVARSGGQVEVTVEIRVARVLPLFPSSVRRTSVVPIERFIPEPER